MQPSARFGRRLAGLVAIASIANGCHAKGQSPGGQAAAVGASDAGARELARAYPRARWRLAPPGTLNHVVLWFSYLLVRDRESDRQTPFSFGQNSEPAPPDRSRADALALASSLAARAAASPGTFATLAREYSEDLATREWGGSMGGLSANYLVGEDAILDALAALKPGEVSSAIETAHGLVVLYRRAPPPLTTVAARRIVVQYDQPEGGATGGPPGPRVGRSRSRALSIAQDIATRVRADAHSFDELLAQYPPARDSSNGGTIGVWTNQEPGPYALAREQLASTPVGGVVGPIEDRADFEVFLRTDVPSDYVDYAVRVIKLAYDPRADRESSASRDSTMTLARSIIRNASKSADQFENFAHLYCCDDPEHWSVGRTDARLVNAVAGLPIGSIATSPVDSESQLIIVKRMDPATTPVSVLFELPAPDAVDLKRLASASSGTAVQKIVRSLGVDGSKELGLDAANTERLEKLHDELAEAFRLGESRGSREAAVDLFASRLHELLSADEYARYQQFAQNRVSAKAMSE